MCAPYSFQDSGTSSFSLEGITDADTALAFLDFLYTGSESVITPDNGTRAEDEPHGQ